MSFDRATDDGASNPFANTVILQNPADSHDLRKFRAIRVYGLTDLRGHPEIALGDATVNFRTVLANPNALFNIAARLRGIPNMAVVTNDVTEVMEIDQGLVVHGELGYHILPGRCSNPSTRAALEQAGAACFDKKPRDARLAAFGDSRDPRFVAEPRNRERALQAFDADVRAADSQVAGYTAQLRQMFSDPVQRQKLDATVGAAEVDRLSNLTDDQLEDDLANSAEFDIQQTFFIPRNPASALPGDVAKIKFAAVSAPQNTLPPTGSTGIQPMAAPPPSGNVPVNPNVFKQTNETLVLPTQTTDLDLQPAIFLTGFTLGRDFEWSHRISFSIKWCIFGCKESYYIEPFASLTYGLGFRAPISTHLHYHRVAYSNDTARASVTADFTPIDGSVADYQATRLPQDLIFDGKELVAQVGAEAGLRYGLPVLGSGDFSIGGTYDFTRGLPFPLKNGQFPPPPAGTELSAAPIIFSELDLLGGTANFGVAGGKVFPAAEVSLVANELSFVLHDEVSNTTAKVNRPDSTVSVGVGPGPFYNSHFAFGDPVYNIAFKITPGVDARLFVDVGVWSHDWDFPVWFPQLAVVLPPGGITFKCHDQTVCEHDYMPTGNRDMAAEISQKNAGIDPKFFSSTAANPVRQTSRDRPVVPPSRSAAQRVDDSGLRLPQTPLPSSATTTTRAANEPLPPATPADDRWTRSVQRTASNAPLTPPIVSEPGGFAGPAPAMTGTFDTDFGVLTLGAREGTYSYKNGRVQIAHIYGDFMDGTWTQSESSQRCADGAYRGKFHFRFNATGFTGSFGVCDGPMGAGQWNGKRR